jgi:DNA-binding phage protein
MQSTEQIERAPQFPRLVHSRQEREHWQDHHFNDIGKICEFLGAEIRASKMKYIKLAEQANCHPTTISNLAHGETHQPRMSTCLQIFRALGFEIVVRG